MARYNTEPAATDPCSPGVVRVVIGRAREWSEYYSRPIHFGAFGCVATADPESRARYYRGFREAAERAGIGWTMSDWKAGFRDWTRRPAAPNPGCARPSSGTVHRARIGKRC